MVVAVILLGSLLLAGCSPDPYAYSGIKIIWDYSYVLSSCDFSGLPLPYDPFPMVWYYQPAELSVYTFTAGDYIDNLISSLTSPSSPVHCSNVPTDVVLYISDSHGTRVVPNDSTLDILAGVTEMTSLRFGPAPNHEEIVRLTLFGYVLDGNHSCVLWSLDGSSPLNVDKTCGGSAKLVCTVKLVEKDLKYDCQDGYDWLGFNIVHDPQWLSWADKFASKNGRP